MMNNYKELVKELEGYTKEELELIYNTQKDLYTEEEMKVVKAQIELCEQREMEKLNAMMPAEISCPKCDGPNPSERENCMFCGADLEKERYYQPEHGESTGEGGGNAFRYVISFLIPLVGFILGAILLAKDNPSEKETGKICIILAMVSMVVTAIYCVYTYMEILKMLS